MVLAWLLGAALGPAAVALPVNWTADALAGAALRWFRRVRHTDELSRFVRSVTGTSIDLTYAEFDALRQLLVDQRTWTLAGRGTVEQLTAQIAHCLPARNGRSINAVNAAAEAIARGLLEFAVSDLEPELFQQVLMARLQRMDTDQASALDKAMLSMHADLAAAFEGLAGLLAEALDRLPPGPAQRGEIALYLRTMANWLNADPWPMDRQFGALAPTPADIERRLRLTVSGEHERDFDADTLARKCQRLVILGDPGAGKTWLAKRTARLCAEDALSALKAGATLDEIELPLYTTCSRLITARGGIRDAIVSSALDQLPDLGGSRISMAIHRFFTERYAPTLVIADSLDEAPGSDERLRQTDKLRWRILLTSRASTWNHQLPLDGSNDSHRVATLRPLRYPDDVEPFIRKWFTEQPERGSDLVKQIGRRRDLQQAATIPLILAFYCIIGGSDMLPAFRRDLYKKVLRRILTGRWRGSNYSVPDADACLQVLRAWAWDGTTTDHFSGIAAWDENVLTGRVSLADAEQAALGHVATPLDIRPDVDTGKISRQFIHRSIREHLVAEHIASLAVEEAADKLIPHLWYDTDWEYAAPAALAMHPQRDQLLRKLVCRAARIDQIPDDLSGIDIGRQWHELLARVAAESSATDWSPAMAGMIRRTLEEPEHFLRTGYFDGVEWGTATSQAREALLGSLTGHSYRGMAETILDRVIHLSPTADDKRDTREALLRLLAEEETGTQTAGNLVSALIDLAPTAGDRREVRETLLMLLARETRASVTREIINGLVRLGLASEDKRQAREALFGVLKRQIGQWAIVAELVGMVQLDPTAEDKQQARDALIWLLAGETSPGGAADLTDALICLASTGEDKRDARDALVALLAETAPPVVPELASGLIQLDPTAEDKRHASEALLERLALETGENAAAELVEGLVQLDLTAEDRCRAREIMIERLATETDGFIGADLMDAAVAFASSTEDRRQICEMLLRLLGEDSSELSENPSLRKKLAAAAAELALTTENRSQIDEAQFWLLDIYSPGDSSKLMDRAVELSQAIGDQWQAREILLQSLAEADLWMVSDLMSKIVGSAQAAEDKHEVRRTLLTLLIRTTNSRKAALMAAGIVQLDPTADEKRRACENLLERLGAASNEYGAETDGYGAADLVACVVQLDPTVEDKRRAREKLLEMLVGEASDQWEERLVNGLIQLVATPEERHETRQALFALMISQSGGWIREKLLDGVIKLATTSDDKRQVRKSLFSLPSHMTVDIVGGVIRLDPTVDEKRQARAALLARLAAISDEWIACGLVSELVRLDPTSEDKREARAALLRLLNNQTGHHMANELMDRMIQLSPTADDLSAWPVRAAAPSAGLLAAVRQNSELDDWLGVISSLAPLLD